LQSEGDYAERVIERPYALRALGATQVTWREEKQGAREMYGRRGEIKESARLLLRKEWERSEVDLSKPLGANLWRQPRNGMERREGVLRSDVSWRGSKQKHPSGADPATQQRGSPKRVGKRSD
jgi:hypothetical protein